MSSSKNEYDALSLEEEGEEAPLRSEKSTNSPEYVSKRSVISKCMINIVLIMTGVLVGVFLIPPYAPPNSLSSAPGVPRKITEATTSKIWDSPDDLYDLHRNDSASAEAWEKTSTRFVWIHKPQAKGLPPSVSIGGDRQLYSVSGYHQIHCTWGLYYSWNRLKERGSSALDEIVPHSGGMSTIDSHFTHCLEMIRQALICHADPALEPMTSEDGEAFAVKAGGWGTRHTCRDIDKWTEWIDEHDFKKL